MARLWGSLASNIRHALFLLLGLDQVAQILHLLVVELIHVRICQLSLVVRAGRACSATDRGHDYCLVLLTSCAVIELT